MSLFPVAKRFLERLRTFSATDAGKRLASGLRTVFLVAIVAVLVYQIGKIGWGSLLRSLPSEPAFYVLLAAMYFLLPITEAAIYGRFWSLPPWQCFAVMIRKRVLNMDVIAYSGEVYLFMWAKDRVRGARKAIVGVIKDNLIVTSISSLLSASLLIGGVFLSGHLVLSEIVEIPGLLYVGLGVLVAVFIGVLVYRFRREIFLLSRRTLTILTAAHVSRFLVGYVLQVAAWWVVLPDVPFETWAILLVVFVVINRTPFVPSSDLVFASAGASIVPWLDAPVAPVVGMLVVRSAVDRVFSLFFFVSSTWWERRRGLPLISAPDDALLAEWSGYSPEEQAEEDSARAAPPPEKDE